MQLKEFRVTGLFGIYDHTVPFVTSEDEEQDASVVIIHGYNGVGKTTTLKMIAGILKLEFDVFRQVPFTFAELKFSTGESLQVFNRGEDSLEVGFADKTVHLHPDHGGPKNPSSRTAVDNFRAVFGEKTQGITFEFLPDARSTREVEADRSNILKYEQQMNLFRDGPEREPEQLLANKVRVFVRNAQLDSGVFFRSDQRDLFQRIMDDLTAPGSNEPNAEEIQTRLQRVRDLDKAHERFGLRCDRWDFEKLIGHLQAHDDRTLTVLSTYSEFLLTRAESRQFLAERLLAFEEVMRGFLRDKDVLVNTRKGIEIVTHAGTVLREQQLSSGEYQLLYLMVAALTTRRRGTVIAIDEPEISMHISWQRKLVPSLIKCSSRAAPQLLLATHSPDIAAGYRDSMVRIGGAYNDASA